MTACAEPLARRIRIARGEEPADVVIAGGAVLDVFTGRLLQADVAIADGIIVGIGEYEGRETVPASDLIVLPGFIEGHVHIESSMVTPDVFACEVAVHGTTTIIADPHEICNVAGKQGLRFMLDCARAARCEVLYMVPSCVPASPLETSGAELSAADVADMLTWEGVLGLGEMMNYPGVVAGDPEVLAKLEAAADRVADGHCPGLSGRDLQAYVTAGPRSDHECTTLAEAEEKLSAGMWVMIREGSAARNLTEISPLLCGPGAGRCLLVSDDLSPEHLLERGHLDYALRQAVARGVPALNAVRAVTLNAATCFRLHDRGAVAPGLRADLVLVRDLEAFEVVATFCAGRPADGSEAEPGPIPAPTELPAWHASGIATNAESLRVPTGDATGSVVRARVIGVIPGQIVTETLVEELPRRQGCVLPVPERDVLKLAVVERHGRRGSVGVGFVKGLGLREGALASTVAHDSHNIVVAGCDDVSMLRAVRELEAMGGGQVACVGERCLARLPLPVGGLMSAEPLGVVAAARQRLRQAASALGCPLDDPFMQLSFLALPVIPHLKLTDLGLVDVDAFRVVPVAAA